jgi:hypothetical protein
VLAAPLRKARAAPSHSRGPKPIGMSIAMIVVSPSSSKSVSIGRRTKSSAKRPSSSATATQPPSFRRHQRLSRLVQTGQCSTASSRIGKSFGLPVASRPPAATAAAATRQSACVRVRPRRACSRRHSPACQPSPSPRGTTRSPANSRRTGSRSAGRRPLTASSTFTAHVQGLSPASWSAWSRRAASGRPRRRSMTTVVSSRTAAINRRDSRRRRVVREPKPMDRHPSRGPRPRSHRERTR